MNVSIMTDGGWTQQPGAVSRQGATSNIHYVTLSAGSLQLSPEGMGALRICLDGVECLAVSPVGPSSNGLGLEYLVVLPSVMTRPFSA